MPTYYYPIAQPDNYWPDHYWPGDYTVAPSGGGGGVFIDYRRAFELERRLREDDELVILLWTTINDD